MASNIQNARVLGSRCPRCRLQGSSPLVPDGADLHGVEVMHHIPDSLSGCNGSAMRVDLVVRMSKGRSMYIFLFDPHSPPSLRDKIVMRSLGPHVVVCQGVRFGRSFVVGGTHEVRREVVTPMISVAGVSDRDDGAVCEACMEAEGRLQDERRERQQDARLRDELIMRRRAEVATRLWNRHRPDGI